MRLRGLLVAVVAGVLVPLVARGQTGVFRSAYTAVNGGLPASGIAVGDFDQDGAQDAALCSVNQGSGPPGNITVLFGFNDGTFGESDPIALPNVPSAMIQGKFDGDSVDDLVVAEQTSPALIVFMQGLGNGSYFALPGPGYPAGDDPVALAKADLDRDGHLDVVVADHGPGTGAPGAVTILLGDGQGGFTLQQQPNPKFGQPNEDQFIDSLPAGVDTAAVAVGNIDSDPGLEILVLNATADSGSGPGTISIFTSNGCHGPLDCASFRPYTPNGTLSVGNMPQDLALVDLDGDGKLDLIVANSNDDDVTVQLGNGDGTFGTAQKLVVGRSPQRLAIGDLNKDGKLDIVTSNEFSVDVSLLLGDGKGGFAPARSFVATPQPKELAVADFNNDGLFDVVVAPTDGSDPVSELLSRPDGSLHGVEDVVAGSGPQSVAVADLDGDGVPDLVASVNSTDVAVFRSLRGGGFAADPSRTVGGRTLGVAAADLNGDVRPDIVVVDQQNSRVAVLFSQGGGSFADPAYYATAANPVAVAVGDFNLDGRPDLAVATDGANRVCKGGSVPDNTPCSRDEDCGPQGLCEAPGVVSILLQNADHTFGAPLNRDLMSEREPIAIAVADVNCDRKDDLIVANLASDSVSVLTSNGDGSFNIFETLGPIKLPVDMAVADFDQDGIPDLAVINSFAVSPPIIHLFQGNCSAPFQNTLPGYNRAVTQLARAIVARDFTGDGLVDVALVDPTDNAVFLLAGDPKHPGALLPQNFDPVSRMPIAVAAGDFDLDGRYDVATANDSIAGNLSVLFNCARDISGVNGAAISCQPFPSKVCQGGTKMGSSCVQDGQCPSSTCVAAPLGSNALRGDANGDGLRTAADLVAVGLEVTDGDGSAVENIGHGTYQASAGVDANGDGRVDAQDRLAVAHRIFGG